jgi:hypothetical protein
MRAQRASVTKLCQLQRSLGCTAGGSGLSIVNREARGTLRGVRARRETHRASKPEATTTLLVDTSIRRCARCACTPHRTPPKSVGGARPRPVCGGPGPSRCRPPQQAGTRSSVWTRSDSGRDAWVQPNAPANLRANTTICERSELPMIACQVQRTLYRWLIPARINPWR